MPIYEYKCEKGHVFEEIQKMTDDPIAECVVCGTACERVLHSPAVHFKGSGFYTTDYANKKVGANAEGSADSGSSDSGSSDSSGSSDGSGSSSDSSSPGSSETKKTEKSTDKTKTKTGSD